MSANHLWRPQLSLFIFPEGTRSASPVPSLLPFKKGAFHLAVQAQLPIVPIVCENYAHVYHSKAKRFEGGEIVIRGESGRSCSRRTGSPAACYSSDSCPPPSLSRPLTLPSPSSPAPLAPPRPNRAPPHRLSRHAVLPPISTEGVTSSHEDIQTLTDKTRDAMLAAIEDLGRKRQAQLVADGRARLTGGAGAAGGAAGEEEDGERTRLLQPAPAPASAPTTAAEGEGETASARLDPAPSSSGDEE